ncbi:MAG: 2-C-methyl-D-erythritol 4-phosphate cytidylyltransferase, partial [Bdellovibrionales bacterium]|nr:2-C-methyl-D-erythritol 4-phosphate cytidylyltransferase [Bdellovibrionales bacterium]
QTPAGSRLGTLRSARAAAEAGGYLDEAGVEDSAVLQRAGHRVAVVEGSYENIKITTPEDTFVAEAILKQRSN